MKNLLLSIGLALLTACASRPAAPVDAAIQSEVIKSGEFTFMAERANPTNYDVLKVMNSIPNSVSTRMLELSRGYTVVVKKGEVTADLPYFGRVYNPSMDVEKAGIKFTSHSFTIDKNFSKKGNTTYKISTNDTAVRNLYIEVYKNGKAFLSVDSNDRQPITYDGYITANDSAK